VEDQFVEYHYIHQKGEYWTLTVVQILRVASEWLNSNYIETGHEIKAEWNISDYWINKAEQDCILCKASGIPCPHYFGCLIL